MDTENGMHINENDVKKNEPISKRKDASDNRLSNVRGQTN